MSGTARGGTRGEARKAGGSGPTSPEALYAAGGLAAAGGAGVTVLMGLILVRVSRWVLGLPDGLSPATGAAAFALLLVCALAVGTLGGGVLVLVSGRPSRRRTPPKTARTTNKADKGVAGSENPGDGAPAGSPRKAALVCALPFLAGTLLAAVVAVALGAVLAAPSTWAAVGLHAALSGTLCGLGAYLGAARLFRDPKATPVPEGD